MCTVHTQKINLYELNKKSALSGLHSFIYDVVIGVIATVLSPYIGRFFISLVLSALFYQFCSISFGLDQWRTAKQHHANTASEYYF